MYHLHDITFTYFFPFTNNEGKKNGECTEDGKTTGSYWSYQAGPAQIVPSVKPPAFIARRFPGTVSRVKVYHKCPPMKVPRKLQNVPQVPTEVLSDDTFTKQILEDEPLPPTQSHQVLPYREEIRTNILSGLTAQRIYQDLVELHLFTRQL